MACGHLWIQAVTGGEQLTKKAIIELRYDVQHSRCYYIHKRRRRQHRGLQSTFVDVIAGGGGLHCGGRLQLECYPAWWQYAIKVVAVLHDWQYTSDCWHGTVPFRFVSFRFVSSLLHMQGVT